MNSHQVTKKMTKSKLSSRKDKNKNYNLPNTLKREKNKRHWKN